MCVLCRAFGNELDTLWHSNAIAVYEDGAVADDTAVRAYATSTTQGPVGDQYIDGLFSGSKWSGTVTYSFTNSTSDYPAGYADGMPSAGFAQVSLVERQVIDRAMAYIENITDLNIQRNDEAGIADGAADIRIARVAAANPTAFAFYPSNAPRGEGGDVWFGTSYTEYANPVLGGYSYLTHLHELGHAFGLKHPHETNAGTTTSSPSLDALEYSVMSYRSFATQSLDVDHYTNEDFGYPQSLMMADILALQRMYGADFSFNGGDSIYKWSATTGEMSINGIGQGAPGANRVFLTIWDGGGNDTYDMSNYASGVSIELTPGASSVTSSAQKAYLGEYHENPRYAQGNVYNAFLYQSDWDSLIENAIGGDGNDTIRGNVANNKLDGGKGNDTLTGSWNDDLFIIHANDGQDVITDFGPNGAWDTIYFDNIAGVRSFIQVMSFATQSGANTVFDFGGGQTLTLLDVTLGDLRAKDFAYNDPLPLSTVAPTDITLVSNTLPENVINADIAELIVDDADGETVFHFTLSDNRFEVVTDSNASWLSLKDGVSLDYETESSVTLNITATDSGGLSYQEQFTISVLDRPGATINGTSGNNIINGAQTIAGQSLSSDEDDTINGLGGNDTLSGLGGRDTISGGAGNDFLYGGDGADKLYGQAGVDNIDGGAGNDTIYISGTEASADTIQGGIGSDAIAVIGTGAATVAGFGPANSIEIWNGNGAALLGTSAANIFDFSGLTAKTGMLYVDAGGGNDTLTGSALDDDLRGGAGNDTVTGGDGNDSLYGGAGADNIDGGAGNDTIYVIGSEATLDTMQGGTGFDTIQASGKITLSTFSAANSIEAWVGNNQAVVGSGLGDTLDFSGLTSKTGMLYVDGAKGNDTLIGSAVNDELRGADGNDRLDGGAGNDLLNGGKGADTFAFKGDFGVDTIATGFIAGIVAGHDVIEFDDAQFADFAFVMSHASQVGTGVVISLDASHSVTIQSMTLAKLVEDDFRFV